MMNPDSTGQPPRIREIPYNYTSFSDREILIRFLGERGWELIESLRGSRRTGRSAHMLFEILGDLWVISRNPFLQDDLLENPKRRKSLFAAHQQRLAQYAARTNNNAKAEELLALTRQCVAGFEQQLERQASSRKRLKQRLGRLSRPDNIDFSGMARVAHATDATDWRVELPFVVLVPDTEAEIAPLVRACIQEGISLIPRGGGTGYTGSAVPLEPWSAVINTEKLDAIGPIEHIRLPGLDESVPTVQVGAGVVTRRVTELAEAQGLAFAVDPTSQDASTIGGNIAMNAGGKKALLWGTTLDNLASWRMVTPDGDWLEVERLNHNLGKIHSQPEVSFRVSRYGTDGRTLKGEPEFLRMPGSLFRKRGLGKDVTDKFLAGLPGVQKEGCDGLITSARFILHRMPSEIRTLCLEFYDPDLGKAVPAILELTQFVEKTSGLELLGLEHLDERYLRAVNYASKSASQLRPKMVLLADLISDDGELLEQVIQNLEQGLGLAARGAELFVARSPEARRRFWLDRARTAAISAHTNAFKINEDVVIPLERLADYSRGIERINIEESIRNKLSIMAAVRDFLATPLPLVQGQEESQESRAILADKQKAALGLLEAASACWQRVLEGLERPAGDFAELLKRQGVSDYKENESLLDLMLSRRLRQSYRQEIAEPLADIFSGKELAKVREQLDAIHAEHRASRLFVALHMHAGDGNVHTNIPVHSQNYAMLRRADELVERIMRLAQSLGGVISGEHGIGITKIQFLEEDKLAAFARYKAQVDPKGHFNPGKLLAGSGLGRAWTPSLQLVEQEALILEESELGELNDDIKHCLRCGKCKPVCMTHVPRANLLYSPRNKILATGLVIEAFLYEEQTRRGLSLRHFAEMNDLADHCTICHKCEQPCPVNIDFGNVTTRMRKILVQRRKKRTALAAWAAMGFLNLRNPRLIETLRALMLRKGYLGLNLGHDLFKRLGLLPKASALPAASQGRPRHQLQHSLQYPIRVGLPRQGLRSLLKLNDSNQIPVLHHPGRIKPDAETLFYFPGCGSERLFSEIGLACLAMLGEAGVRTVLPPGQLCCGYPQSAVGQDQKGRAITTENRVLLHRVAKSLSYLDIHTVVVSCGTCLDQLLKYELERIFTGARLLDIHEYLAERGLGLAPNEDSYLYHDPCHTPIKQHNPIAIGKQLLGATLVQSERCCGEAGTLGVGRPDIANQLRFRKLESLEAAKAASPTPAKALLTSCPACQQGLARYRDESGLEPKYIVVRLAEQLLGPNWQQSYVKILEAGGIERVLL